MKFEEDYESRVDFEDALHDLYIKFGVKPKTIKKRLIKEV